MDLICPKCGAKSSEKEFIEAFCVDCYGVDLKLPKPSEIHVTLCKRCGNMLLRGEWHKFNSNKISDAVERKCRGTFEEVSYDYERGILTFTVKIGKKIREFERAFLPDKDSGICPACSRISGGYFEAIIQLRGDNLTRLKQYSDSLQKRLSEKTFVSKVEEKKEGIDLYVGNSKVVVTDFHKRGIKCIMSSKLFGRKEGKLLYRTTFLLRL